MPFQPNVGDTLIIEGTTYRVTEHPSAPGMPFGQEGRQAIVYQLAAESRTCALKVFKSRFRFPALVALADKLEPFSQLPGLAVCKRTVLTVRRHSDLLRQSPDLIYSVVMPWIPGPTWVQIVMEKRRLTPDQSLEIARAFANVLVSMEENGLAHCDLSGPNVLLPIMANDGDARRSDPVALVDVEQIFRSGLDRPAVMTSGSGGYSHKTVHDGMWSADADRFAGAILLAEMLGWCDDRALSAAWSESFFAPDEMQHDCARYDTMQTVLRERWGEGIAGLFERIWSSETLADCPTFAEWLMILPERAPVESKQASTPTQQTKPAPTADAIQALLDVARQLEQQGDIKSAQLIYRQAQAKAEPGSPLAQELDLVIKNVRLPQKDKVTVPASALGKPKVSVLAIAAPAVLVLLLAAFAARSLVQDPTPTPMPSPVALPTSTFSPAPTKPVSSPTPVPSQTPLPTYTPYPTYTPAPVPSPIAASAPTAAPTATARPATPVPVQRAGYPAPVLVSPPNDQRFEQRMPTLAWQPVGDLAADEYYVVTIPHAQGVDEQWTKDTRVNPPAYLLNLAFPNHRYTWDVRVRLHTGTKANGGKDGPERGAVSEQGSFYWFGQPTSPLPTQPTSPRP